MDMSSRDLSETAVFARQLCSRLTEACWLGWVRGWCERVVILFLSLGVYALVFLLGNHLQEHSVCSRRTGAPCLRALIQLGESPIAGAMIWWHGIRGASAIRGRQHNKALMSIR